MVVAQIKQYLAQLDLGKNFHQNLNQLSTSVYLVGGSVRDGILQRYKNPWDLDFVVPEKAIPIARSIADFYQAGFVVLDQERDIARVVLPQGTLDFARQVGATIEEDLERRDFTINAIAYNLTTQQLVDPGKGLADLQRGTLRMVSPRNLDDDPLRLLRAYRQAAQLNLTIEDRTREAIRERGGQLSAIAAERVQTELNYLFTAPQGNPWLQAAISDGLLDYWLPSVHQANLAELQRLETGIDLGLKLGGNLTELKILSKLATLVSEDPEIAEGELIKLKYSRSQIKTVTKTVKYLPDLASNFNHLSLREQYFWFLAVQEVFPVLIVRAIASGIEQQQLHRAIARYLDPQDPVAHPQPLVTGNDLLQALNLKPSPLIGKLLTELQVAQVESKINSVHQAIELARSILKEQDQIPQ